MDNDDAIDLGCFQFFILIYNCIVAEETDQQRQPVYIEMQPLRPRQQPQQQPQQPQHHLALALPIAQPPLIRQRKHICSESPEFPPIPQTSSSTISPEPSIELKVACPEPTADTFETDFEIIEITDVNKEA